MDITINNDKGEFKLELQKKGEVTKVNFIYTITLDKNEFVINISNVENDIYFSKILGERLYYKLLTLDKEKFSDHIMSVYNNDIFDLWSKKYPQEFKFQNLTLDTTHHSDIKPILYVFKKLNFEDTIVVESIPVVATVKVSANDNIWKKLTKYLSSNNFHIYNSDEFIKVLQFDISLYSIPFFNSRTVDASYELKLTNSLIDKEFKVSITLPKFIKRLTKYVNTNHNNMENMSVNIENFISEYFDEYNILIKDYVEYIMLYINGKYNVIQHNKIYNSINLNDVSYNYIPSHAISGYDVRYGYKFIQESTIVILYADMYKDNKRITGLNKLISIDELLTVVDINKSTRGNESPYRGYGQTIYYKLISELLEPFGAIIDITMTCHFDKIESIEEIVNDETKWKYVSDTVISFKQEDDKCIIQFLYETEDSIGNAEQTFTGDNILDKIYRFLSNNTQFKIIKYKER